MSTQQAGSAMSVPAFIPVAVSHVAYCRYISLGLVAGLRVANASLSVTEATRGTPRESAKQNLSVSVRPHEFTFYRGP